MAGGEIAGGPGRLSNVVFMGMGEPLANYPRVRKTLDALLTPAPHGLGLSQRSVTVSTVGLVPAIRRLTDEGLHVTLAVSLHAPDDELRDTLVPINTRWKVDEVLAAADDYARRTGRRYSVEYALIRGVNDQPFRADLLGRLLSSRLAHVNLIPLNPTPGSPWDASPLPAQREFVARLRAAGVPTTVRDTRGSDIDGACGQLAAADRVDGLPVPGMALPVPGLGDVGTAWSVSGGGDADEGRAPRGGPASGPRPTGPRTPTSPAAGCGPPCSVRWTAW
jgi:23S rRNA (adenine2503-C2)-methyltransferase